MFFWMVLPTVKYTDYDVIKLGKDEFTHTLFHWNSIERWELNMIPDLIFSGINIDPSWYVTKYPAINSGIYGIIAYKHFGNKKVPHDAFYIVRYNEEFITTKFTVNNTYNSQLRRDIPAGESVTHYINFHRSIDSGDGSEGCFTAFPNEFDKFRSAFSYYDKGTMVFMKE